MLAMRNQKYWQRKDNLDDVFLELTWRDIREELVSESEWMRASMNARRRG